jgi:hypothetical protein
VLISTYLSLCLFCLRQKATLPRVAFFSLIGKFDTKIRELRICDNHLTFAWLCFILKRKGKADRMTDRQITNKKSIQSKSKTHKVLVLGNGIYKVTSGESGEVYTVAMTERGATCTCDWGMYREWVDPRSGCSHVVAAFRKSYEPRARAVSMWTSQEDADRQHRHQFNIGDGVTVTTRKKANGRKSEAQLMTELGF